MYANVQSFHTTIPFHADISYTTSQSETLIMLFLRAYLQMFTIMSVKLHIQNFSLKTALQSDHMIL